MASGKTRKNHYVSQFILRGFSSDKERNKVWAYDIINGEINEKPIKSIGYLKDGWSQEVEDFLGKRYEDTSAKIIEKIIASIHFFEKTSKIDSANKLSKKDYELILEFIGMQFARSINSSKYLEPKMEIFLLRYQSIYDIFTRYCSRIEKIIPHFEQDSTTYNSSHRELRSAALNIEWLRDFSNLIMQSLKQKQLHIFWIPKNRGFIYSDCPFALLNRKYGLAYAESEWVIPITSNLILYFSNTLSDNKIQYGYNPIEPKILKIINKHIASQATRYIFASTKKLALKYGEMHDKIKESYFFDNLMN